MKFRDLTIGERKRLFSESREIRESVVEYYRDRIKRFISELTDDYLDGIIDPEFPMYTIGDYLNLIHTEVDMTKDLIDGPWLEEEVDTLFDFAFEIKVNRKGVEE